MSDITTNILEAIDVIVEKRLAALKFDRTIQGHIIKVENVDKGEYKVQYQDSVLTCYCDSPNTVFYKEGAQVYVLIPSNDFSTRKTILGTTDGDIYDSAYSVWIGTGNPNTAPNRPDLNWTSVEEQDFHVGDTYRDSSSDLLYIYQKTGALFSWELVPEKGEDGVDGVDGRSAITLKQSGTFTMANKTSAILVGSTASGAWPTGPFQNNDIWIVTNFPYKDKYTPAGFPYAGSPGTGGWKTYTYQAGAWVTDSTSTEINGSILAANTVVGESIIGRTISAEKLTISNNSNNLIIDPYFEKFLYRATDDIWAVHAINVDKVADATYGTALRVIANSTIQDSWPLQKLNVIPGEQYLVKVMAKRSNPSPVAVSGTLYIGGAIGTKKDGSTVYTYAAKTATSLETEWTQYTYKYTVPNDVYQAQFGWVSSRADVLPVGLMIDFTQLEVYRVNDGELLVEGTVSADYIRVTGDIYKADVALFSQIGSTGRIENNIVSPADKLSLKGLVEEAIRWSESINDVNSPYHIFYIQANNERLLYDAAFENLCGSISPSVDSIFTTYPLLLETNSATDYSANTAAITDINGRISTYIASYNLLVSYLNSFFANDTGIVSIDSDGVHIGDGDAVGASSDLTSESLTFYYRAIVGGAKTPMVRVGSSKTSLKNVEIGTTTGSPTTVEGGMTISGDVILGTLKVTTTGTSSIINFI